MAVPVDPRVATRVSASVEADRCLDVLAVPDDAVAHLDMAVLGMDGRVLGRAGGHGRARSLVICSATSAPITVELRPHVGEGLVAIVLSRSAEGAASELDTDALVYDVSPPLDLGTSRERYAARLERAGYRTAKVIATRALSVGRRESVPVELPGGCFRLDVLTGRPMRGVRAWLWAADGSLIAADRDSSHATLFACTRGGTAQLDAEALARPGPCAVELRAEPGTPQVLRRHPLAAGRLLARMLARGVIRRAAQVGRANVVRLSAARREQTMLVVPVGRCVDLTLALGPGATGAEVRLVDVADEQEISLTRGTDAASARACALDRPATLRVRAELRCTVGETDALVATRMLAPKP